MLLVRKDEVHLDWPPQQQHVNSSLAETIPLLSKWMENEYELGKVVSNRGKVVRADKEIPIGRFGCPTFGSRTHKADVPNLWVGF